MSWTEGQEICKGGSREKSKPGTVEDDGSGETQAEGRGRRNWSWRRMCRRYQLLCYRSRNVNNRACEFSQVGEVVLLAGGPRGRHSKQSMSEGFVVSKYSEISTF